MKTRINTAAMTVFVATFVCCLAGCEVNHGDKTAPAPVVDASISSSDAGQSADAGSPVAEVAQTQDAGPEIVVDLCKGVDCDDGNPCTKDSCDPTTGKCLNKALVTVPPLVCDDGNPCTVDDKCFAGKCAAGPAMDCDDGNPCTDDACKDGTCKHTPNAAQCDDGDANTTGDTCLNGACKGTQKQSGGCKSNADCAAFDDGNACNGVAICKAGLCGLTEPVVCVPSSACTVSSCDPATGACKEGQGPNAKPCDDGNACTSGDTCLNGACKGELVNCDDSNPCTDDSCNGGVCKHVNNAVACDDGNACTSGDKCSGGVCASGVNTCECQSNTDCAALEDGNVCNGTLVCKGAKCVVDPKTIVVCSAVQDTACGKNTCDTATGKCALVPANAGAKCNDNDACTKDDVCSGGTCVGDLVSCDDANPCTDDACDPKKGCVHLPNAATCDDGNALTTGDACKYGKCSGTLVVVQCDTTDDCDDGLFCNGQEKCVAGVCKPGTPFVCDDGNACTVDKCVEAGGLLEGHCIHTPMDSSCPAGQFCHTSSSLLVGSELQGCVQCESSSDCDDKNPCTDDSCNAKSGTCSHSSETSDGWGWPSCSDGNACTKGDACKEGKCVGEAVNCDDSNPCTDDSCDPKKGCVNTPNTAACDDGNACTTGDKCSGSVCKGATVNADDGNACTYDYCDKQYGVVHYAKNCDDGNACTTDVCDALKGCIGIPNSAACNDGNACTSGEKCSDSKCAGGTTLSCDDANPCTADACDSKVGCTHTPIAGCPGTTPPPASANTCLRWSNPSGGTFTFATIYGCVGSFNASNKTFSCDGAVGNWKDQVTASGSNPSPTWCATVPAGKALSAAANFSPCVQSTALGYCSFWSPAGDGKVPVTKLDIPGKVEYSVDGGKTYVTLPNTTDSTAQAFLLDNGQGGANVVVKQ